MFVYVENPSYKKSEKFKITILHNGIPKHEISDVLLKCAK